MKFITFDIKADTITDSDALEVFELHFADNLKTYRESIDGKAEAKAKEDKSIIK